MPQEKFISKFEESFFGQLRDSLKKLTDLLYEYKIRFTVIGGASLQYHNYTRTTMDIDLLVDVRDKEKLRQIPIGLFREVSHIEGRKFILQSEKAEVEILYSGESVGQGLVYDNPLKVVDKSSYVPYIDLEHLIIYKTNLQLTYEHRAKDKGDVLALIEINNLPLDFLKGKTTNNIEKEYQRLWFVVQDSKNESLSYARIYLKDK